MRSITIIYSLGMFNKEPVQLVGMHRMLISGQPDIRLILKSDTGYPGTRNIRQLLNIFTLFTNLYFVLSN